MLSRFADAAVPLDRALITPLAERGDRHARQRCLAALAGQEGQAIDVAT